MLRAQAARATRAPPPMHHRSRTRAERTAELRARVVPARTVERRVTRAAAVAAARSVGVRRAARSRSFSRSRIYRSCDDAGAPTRFTDPDAYRSPPPALGLLDTR